MTKTTTLDYIILGLLQENSLTGYRIRKTFEDTALGNFGGSPGTIYPALKRLEKNRLIAKQNHQGSTKSDFRITEEGLDQLRNWLQELPSTDEIKKNPEILVLKFAFMDPLIDRDQKLEYLESMKYQLESYLKELEHYLRHETNDMPESGRIAFEHGLLSYRASIQWCILAKDSLSNS